MPEEKKQIIMTGVTSFVGAAAARELLGRGYQVFGILRPGSKNRGPLERSLKEFLDRGQLILLENDLSAPGRLPLLLSGKLSPGGIFCHFGWGGSGSGARNNESLQRSNLRFSLETLEAAKEMGCGRFLFSGSQAEYGLHTDLITEESACAPRSAYGEAKLAMREEGEALARRLGITYLHGRIFSVYGPGDHPWTLVETCLDACLKGQEFRMGACTQLWNFLYIDDLASAAAALAELKESEIGKLESPVFNLAGEETKPLRDFVEEINRICGGRGRLIYHARPENAEGLVNLAPSIEKLKTASGWRPRTDFQEGIRRLMIDKRKK